MTQPSADDAGPGCGSGSQHGFDRRVALGLMGSAAALLAAGCGASPAGRAGGATRTSGAPTAGPERDLALVRAALAQERRLLAGLGVAQRRFPQAAEPLYLMTQQQAAHVARLRATLVSPGAVRRVSPPPLADALAQARVQLGSLQHAGAGARRADCIAADDGRLAALFASVAAAHAVAAGQLGAAESSVLVAPTTTPDASRLQPCLAAEHAALFGYGVLGGVLRAGVSDSTAAGLAIVGYDAHRTRRDQLSELIAGAGLTPVAALPAYRISPDVTGPDSAARCAERIEARCAAVYLQTTSVVSAATRSFTCDVVGDCARRATGWGAPPVAFPGLA